MVDNLLSITRLHDVHGFYTFESVDLPGVVEEALSRFQLQLKEQRFELLVDIPAGIPPVHGDRAAILQVLDNLLDNAIRYSNGATTLALNASVSGNQVSLRITDAGPGIPRDELPRVFDKFFRGRSSASSGSGLGLAIVQRVVNDHGGHVRLRSAPGEGTTAEVLLCLAEREEVDDEAKTACR
jgi:signal transduction histidine kinase